MAIYSEGQPKCACCGEKELSFLTIDHINGKGNIHRKEMELNKIKSIYVSVGDQVKMGQLLAEEVNSDYAASLRGAVAARNAAEAELKQAREGVDVQKAKLHLQPVKFRFIDIAALTTSSSHATMKTRVTLQKIPDFLASTMTATNLGPDLVLPRHGIHLYIANHFHFHFHPLPLSLASPTHQFSMQ